jgi:hypothetical protein
VRLSRNHGFSSSELREIEKIVEENERQLIEIWDEFFSGKS